MSDELHGHILGLSPAERHRVERLYRRLLPPQSVLTHDLAREMSEASHALHRRIGVLVDRAGRIERVAIGDARKVDVPRQPSAPSGREDRKSTRLNSSHLGISYAVFCLKKKTQNNNQYH